MKFKRNTLYIILLLMVIFLFAYYIYSMSPARYKEDVALFKDIISTNFSYYEYKVYTLVMLPLYLLFHNAVIINPMQHIIRQKSKKRVVWLNIRTNMITSFLFVFIVYVIGILFPTYYGVMNTEFLLTYSIQSVFTWLLYIFVNNVVLIIKTFTLHSIVQIGIPYILIVFYYVNKQLYNIFSEINLSISCYAHFNMIPLAAYGDYILKIIMIIMILMITSIGIKLYVCSEDEYWDA